MNRCETILRHSTFQSRLMISIFYSYYLNIHRNCIIGPQLDVKICALGTVINRLSYPADYCHLEGTGRQSQPMPIRWMAWESILMVSNEIINKKNICIHE